MPTCLVQLISDDHKFLVFNSFSLMIKLCTFAYIVEPRVNWGEIRVAREWWGCHWNAAKLPSSAMQSAKVVVNLFVGQTTNFTAMSARCVIRIVGKYKGDNGFSQLLICCSRWNRKV